ncbi:MAG: efflux RND transporter periplasmic adaptor subunit [Desulfobulbaceae bacterium]|nr:efflux RND transporter periplasmic adaptor subunit [Desulfobulbaceae bacterium]
MGFSSLFSRYGNLAASTILVFLLLLLVACSGDHAGSNKNKGQQGQRKRPEVPVSTALATKKTVPVELTATGHVEAQATVEIRSQVTGTLKSVHFSEGETVKAGELLFTIDTRPFAAALAKAEAVLDKNRAELNNARREEERYTRAAKRGLVSAEQADQTITRAATLAAAIKEAQAAVDTARLELDYCLIRSPMEGRAGEIQIHQGNLIMANSAAPLVTVRRMQPLEVAITVPGRHLSEIMAQQALGQLQVTATPPGAEPVSGMLSFVDNSVDPSTGVIRLKATFNRDGASLWPGQMVDVRLRIKDLPDRITIPAQAVQTGQEGSYLYVVNKENTVALRPVTVNLNVAGEAVIEKNLAEGERVVIDGQLQLADGARVQERGRTVGTKRPGKESSPEAKAKGPARP